MLRNFVLHSACDTNIGSDGLFKQFMFCPAEVAIPWPDPPYGDQYQQVAQGELRRMEFGGLRSRCNQGWPKFLRPAKVRDSMHESKFTSQGDSPYFHPLSVVVAKKGSDC